MDVESRLVGTAEPRHRRQRSAARAKRIVNGARALGRSRGRAALDEGTQLRGVSRAQQIPVVLIEYVLMVEAVVTVDLDLTASAMRTREDDRMSVRNVVAGLALGNVRLLDANQHDDSILVA